MKKTMKKILCSLLVVVMCFTSAPLQGFADVLTLKASAAKITSYSQGDIIEFGWYPQSKVTDSALISSLNSAGSQWISYNYYSGTSDWDDGKMAPSDYMRYKDVMYGSDKYRGVIFDSYRPDFTGYTSSSSNTNQVDNGYYTNTVYWFKYEPIKWRVLDPSAGMVMSETILDSQPYNSYVLYSGGEYYGDSSKSYYANNYAKSSLRQWLNNDFYNTAFSSSQQNIIKSTTLDNSTFSSSYSEYNAPSTSDKIYLLSYNDVKNSNYGFSSNFSSYDTARRAKGSDYAKSQGLWVTTSSSYYGNSYWLLRSPGSSSDYCCNVRSDSDFNNLCNVSVSSDGIRPALNFNLSSEIFQSDVKDTGNSSGNGAGSTTQKSSYFIVSSDQYSVDSINRKETATYKIHLLDENSDFLPVDNVTVQNNTTDIVNISTNKVSETELELTVEPIKDGDTSISLFNGDGSVEQFFNFTVYSNTTTYRADQVPVTNEKLKTNFSRGDMTVDNFEYIFDENKGKYIATMDVYNRSSSIGVVSAYTQDGLISDIEQVDPYVPLPGDFGEFLVYLGTGAVSIAKGENWNYRYSGYCQKTSIEIEVPEDGYLTVSCDVTSDNAAFIYNLVSIGVDFAFKTAEVIDVLGTDTDKLAKDTTKTLAKKVSEYFNEDSEWTKGAIKKLAKKLSKQFNMAYLEEISVLSLEMLDEMYMNVGEDFSDAVLEVIIDLTKEEIKEFGVMAAAKKLVKDKVIGTAEKTLLKAASIMFDGGSYVNLVNSILGAYRYNVGTGKTMVVFKPKGEDGFICKDTIKVKSDIITDEVLLHTYIIKDTQKEDAFVRKTIYSDFNRGDGLRKEELSIDLNRIIEIHEISLWKNGQEVFDTFTATVEMNLPSYIDKRTCSIYRVEKDGTYTKLDTKIEGNKIIFETNHFSEYILTGVIEDLQETTPCDVHVYEEVRTEPSCTEEGSITYTCYCGDTYTETIEANGHTDSEWVVDKDSTCSAEGSKHIECTVCEEVLKTESIAKLPHSYSSVVTEATCETGGYTTYTCTCGETYTGDKTPAKGHDYAEGVCKNCGDSKVDNCSCNCHKSGLMGIIWKILRFFYKLFKINPVCDCGVAHY